MREPLRIVPPGESTLDALTGFFRKMWDPGATTAGVEASFRRAAQDNPNRPGEAPPTLMMLRGEEAIGYVTTVPMRLWCAGSESEMHFVKGLAILPELRNGPAAFMLLREITQGLTCAMCMTVGPLLRRMFSRAGYTELGALPNHLRVLDFGEFLARVDPQAAGLDVSPLKRTVLSVVKSGVVRPLAAAAASTSLNGWSLLSRGRGTARVVQGSLDPAELNDLWKRSRGSLEAAPVRDAQYLIRRYADPADPYVILEVREEKRLTGIAFLRRPRDQSDPRLRGIRVAALADMVAPAPSAAVSALLRAAEGVARELGAHALLMTASHRSLAGAGFRRGYLPAPGNVYAFFKDATGKLRPPASFDGWWLTRGDAYADEVF